MVFGGIKNLFLEYKASIVTQYHYLVQEVGYFFFQPVTSRRSSVVLNHKEICN